ncbi:MAG: response regulator, partial [Brevundimonas sp.]
KCETFDLILMDMQMPVMDGLTAIAQIRALEATGDVVTTPIYVLSANAMPEDIAKSMAAGADGHISKPIEATRLLDQVCQAITAVRSTDLANVA